MLALRLYKSYRWALAAIAQHGAENVAVLVQGQMSKADEIESAGISAVLKKPKEEELILKPVVFVASEPALAASFVKPPFDEEKPRFFLDFCAQIREI